MDIAAERPGGRRLGAPPVQEAPSPIAALRAEHVAMLESTRAIEGLIAHGVLTDAHVLEIEERLRALRFGLPRHLVNEEQGLYPELLRADPSVAPALAEVTRLHHATEEGFAHLQAQFLALSMDPASIGARRRATKAAREFRGALERVNTAEEEGPFALAERLLDAEARGRVASLMDEAAFHDRLKEAQHR